MNADRWQTIKRIFQSVLDVPEADRAAALDRLAEDDDELRAEVESLLANHQTDSFIEPPNSIRVAAAMENAESKSRVGRMVGAYRLVRVLDAGGMGHVYLAERADGQFEKQVAVKVIRRSVDTPELRQRFQNEQRALAGLDHPNIAKLLDGGVTGDGLSYLVMEYVSGRPIDIYCDENRLDLHQRLTLFRTVCAAVHFAHQRLIVHRDLKPGNIFVTENGTPMLLDFGIAKLIDDEDADSAQTAPATMSFMTPQYASPEQIRGQRITTSTDVYSLGVILFELLTGQKPYRVQSSAPHELATIICEQPPVRPSTAVRTTTTRRRSQKTDGTQTIRAMGSDAVRLRRRLAGDLDNIVLMALRKEPGRRYGSVEQFSEDIRRYLDGLPIIARKDTFTYRTAKFVRRNRPAVIAAAVVVMSFVGGIIGTSVALVRVRDAKDKTQLMNEYLQQMLAEANVSETGRDMTLREVLDRAADRVGVDFASHPEIEAAVRETIGNAYVSLRHANKAIEQLERSLALRRDVFGEPSIEVARSLHLLSNAQLIAGDYKTAEDTSAKGIDMRRKLLGADDMETARMLSDLAVIVKERGDYDHAEQLYRKALALTERFATGPDVDVASNLNNLAVLLKLEGRLDEADQLYQRAYEINREIFGDEHYITINAMSNLATLRLAQGRSRDARELFEKTLALYRKTISPDHPRVAIAANNFAFLLMSLGEYDQAESLYRESLEVNRKVFGEDHARTGTSLHNLARLLGIKGEFAEAERLCREGLKIREVSLGADHPVVATSHDGLGNILLDEGKLAEAAEQIESAMRIRKRVYAEDHVDLAISHVSVARLALARNQPDAALTAANEAVAMYTRLLGASHPSTFDALAVRADALIQVGRPGDALEDLATAEAGVREFASEHHPLLGKIDVLRGDAERALHHMDAARHAYTEAIQVLRPLLQSGHPMLQRARSGLRSVEEHAKGTVAASADNTGAD